MSDETDELEGLPELAPGSKWDGHVVVDHLEDTCLAYEDVILLSGYKNFYIQDVRAVIALHDRGNGEYWRDRMKALAADLLEDALQGLENASTYRPGSSDWHRNRAQAESFRDAAHRILAILDEVPA